MAGPWPIFTAFRVSQEPPTRRFKGIIPETSLVVVRECKAARCSVSNRCCVLSPLRLFVWLYTKPEQYVGNEGRETSEDRDREPVTNDAHGRWPGTIGSRGRRLKGLIQVSGEWDIQRNNSGSKPGRSGQRPKQYIPCKRRWIPVHLTGQLNG